MTNVHRIGVWYGRVVVRTRGKRNKVPALNSEQRTEEGTIYGDHGAHAPAISSESTNATRLVAQGFGVRRIRM